MNRVKEIFSQTLLICALLACSLLTPSRIDASDGRPEGGLSGNWHTVWTIMEYGGMKTYEFDMYISQSGSQVTGTSSYYNWSINGNLSGTRLTGNWAASLPQGSPHVRGQFDFIIASSGYSFNGIFKGEYHYTWDSRFTVVGTRTDSGGNVSPGNSSQYPNPTPSTDSQPSSSHTGECSFTGTWDTDYGELHLIQNGNILTGTYNYQDGQITGTVTGNTATGTWSESPTHQPPLDAGDFIFTIGPGCSSFTGQWRYGSCDWDGDINGTRSSQPSQPSSNAAGLWAGTWETRWGTMALTQNGSQVTGSYSHDSGKITGTVSGSLFTGWWSESPSYSAPRDAGAVELIMSSDGKALSGRWKYGTSGSWYENDWSGTRTETPQILPVVSDWNGTWNTDWGTMQLTQTDTRVNGNYAYSNGRITGTAFGNTLTGNWSKAPSYSSPNEAGKLELTLSKDGNSFQGRWKYADCSWAGNWNGVLTNSNINPSPSQGINHQPVANFTFIPQTPATGSTVVATSQSSDPDGDALSYTWYFDGALQNLYNGKPYFIYTNMQAGTHSIYLQVSDGKGGNASQQYQVYVAQAPSPQPSPSTNRAPTVSLYMSPQAPTVTDTLVVTAQAFDADGDNLMYSWYRDGATAAEYNNQTYILWAYPSFGAHTVSLQVSDGKGGIASANQNISVSQPVSPGVNAAPKAYFTIDPPQPKSGDDISIIDQSTNPNNDILSRVWTVDGQQMSQYANQSQWKWTKPSAGGHTVQLTVNDGKGGMDSFSRRIKLSGGTTPVPDDNANPSPKPRWKLGPLSCFIATAAYGSETAAELDKLRAYRDKVLLKSEPGQWLVDTYYQVSPPLAEFISQHEELRTIVREGILDPVVNLLKITEFYWNN